MNTLPRSTRRSERTPSVRPLLLVLAGVATMLAAPAARSQCGPLSLPLGDGFDEERFGASVSIDGPWVLVGAPNDEETRGSVLVYHNEAPNWVLYDELRASDGEVGDRFGGACWIEGERALVGAPEASYFDGELPFAGAAYVFELQQGVWVQTAKLIAADFSPNQFLGWSVCMSGDTAVVGAPGTGIPSAYTFERQPGGWVQTAKLFPSAGPSSGFGFAVAIDGEALVVGARFDETAAYNAGAGFVFERAGAGWTEVQRLAPLDLVEDALFGWSVALEGETALVGAVRAPGVQPSAGAVYAFERHGAGWLQTDRLTGSDAVAGDRFGSACALEGDEALIGVSLYDHLAWQASGCAYRFRREGTSWTETELLASLAPSNAAEFGSALSSSGGSALIGALGENVEGLDIGAAYLFPPAQGGTSSYCSTSANSAGAGARIASAGTTSVAANDFRLIVTAAVPNQSGLFYYGPQAIEIPFGDGWRCVGNVPVGVFRLDPIVHLDFVGDATRPLDLTLPPADAGPGAILPGSTWYFQFWYRDPWGAGGHGFNFSDGLMATFCP